MSLSVQVEVIIQSVSQSVVSQSVIAGHLLNIYVLYVCYILELR